jgi:hypothetical protein
MTSWVNADGMGGKNNYQLLITNEEAGGFAAVGLIDYN